MYLRKSDVGIILFFATVALFILLLFGCSGDVVQPMFGVPDSVAVTTRSAIQGQQGYYFELTRAAASSTSEVVFGITHASVSPHPFYILVRDAADTPEGAAIRRLQRATHAGFAREVPQGYVLLGTKEVEIDIRLGQNTPTYSNTLYFFCTTQRGHKVYFPVCLTFDDMAYRKFWEIVNAGAKVINTGDDSTDGKTGDETDFVTWLSAPLDPTAGPSPAYISEVRYTVGEYTDPNISSVRERQEALIRATYGDNYQNDLALQRAIRIADSVSERYRQSWLVYLADRDGEKLGRTRNAILRDATGLHYYTQEFVEENLESPYEQILGKNLPTAYGLLIEHLRLRFTHPNERKEELLLRLNQSMANNHIVVENPWTK